jgi:hypothetical protein
LLGCGATVQKLKACGWETHDFVLWDGRGSADDNAMDKHPLIATVRKVEERISSFSPERIYTHSIADLNVDHQIVHKAVLTATRPIKGSSVPYVNEVYCFETASSTEWNFTGTAFRPNVFESATEEELNMKIDMLFDKYPQEMRDFPHPRSVEYLTACARRWGGVAGVDLAEAFELVRLVR